VPDFEVFINVVEAGETLQVTVVENFVPLEIEITPENTKGDPGLPGQQGPAGPQGPPGTGLDANYLHLQAVPALTWEIPHGLGKIPAITIKDSSGRELESDIEHVTNMLARAYHSAPFSGEASCN
jgi:hypothetical protein